jgi:hypothetical protein
MTEELPVVKGMRMVRPSHDKDLKQRLRAGIHKSADPYELGDEAANHIESCEIGISQCLSRIEQLEALLKRLNVCFQVSAPLFGAQWCRSVHISDALIEDVRAAVGEKKDD